jgi:hypothetical protein
MYFLKLKALEQLGRNPNKPHGSQDREHDEQIRYLAITRRFNISEDLEQGKLIYRGPLKKFRPPDGLSW